MKMYEILAIDVWGNERDGFEINNMINTGVVFEVDDKDDDKKLLKRLRKALGHRADAKGYHDPFQDEYMLCFHRNKDGKPCYYARLIKGEMI